MGSYWLANHRFIAGLKAMDSKFVGWVLPFLAVVAFLPLPAATMGQYSENPVAVGFFAVTVAAVSFLEFCLLRRAHPLRSQSISRTTIRFSAAPTPR